VSEGSAAKLVNMANQIARNLRHDVDPRAAVADHIEAFWTARMKDAILAYNGGDLDPIALGAVAILASGKMAERHTRASDPAARGSDAG
jgi:hypothetical protein